MQLQNLKIDLKALCIVFLASMFFMSNEGRAYAFC